MVSNIWVAAADNQVAIVDDFLKSGQYTPNAKDPNGYTPIHAAASYGHIGLLRLLISKGGDINIQDNEGDTPLHHCEDVRTAKVLVKDLDCDWTIKNEDGLTALEYRIEDEEFPELIEYLKTVKYEAEGPDAVQTATPSEEAASGSSDIHSSLPEAVDGQNIRFSLESEVEGEISEDRRKQIEAIINGENPEEALRQLVTNAVHEGMAQYREVQPGGENEVSKKRKE
ncbi:hypothetical protein PSN45_005226 [Yamadazyma tenuis]|uniref:Ankyrin n=1 Tax=Candida tenuis (strain ATCC 10573 / BCRC 21748 / CBS 615 / JCM 9827 / NBRC 10315 / NRRL Y-1498 / VKM Y-70) TaxID=590646 RepID=G3B143_CANTC|nr:ankyrin [Yamadazyma tenuis ATCC 10573]EGV64874.1 ankyrin [Yamadazyma tenuis ATCC 10573]WEJ97668.1 hypothetical protein PSN45_005226 [Yamadazyma tenuis]